MYTPAFIEAAVSGEWDPVEPFGCYVSRSTVKTSELPLDQATPTLYVVAGEDDLVATDVGRADFPVLCELGYQLEYLECEGADHSDGAIDSLPYQWQWIQERMAGTALEQPCVMTAPVDCSAFELMD